MCFFTGDRPERDRPPQMRYICTGAYVTVGSALQETVKGAQDARVMFYLSRGAKTFVFTGAVTTGVIWWVCWSESEVSSIGSMNSRSIIACSHAHMLGREEGSSAPLVTAFEPSYHRSKHSIYCDE